MVGQGAVDQEGDSLVVVAFLSASGGGGEELKGGVVGVESGDLFGIQETDFGEPKR